MRTKYFIHRLARKDDTYNTLKRIHKGELEYFSFKVTESDLPAAWKPSCYTNDEINDRKTFRQVTRDEARKLRPLAFRSPKKDRTTEPAPVATGKKSPPPGLQLANQYRTAVQGLDYKGSQKIAAIKEVRHIGCFGLAESLTIVENFDKFLAFVEKHNALPEVGNRFDSNPFTKKA